jgi:hypothetical protein
VIRNTAEALVVALTDEKEKIVAENNMECLANGRTRVKEREDWFCKKEKGFQ